MLDTKRHWFKSLEVLVGKTFSLLPITPNGYTYLSGVFALIGMYYMIMQELALSVVFFFIGAFLDFVDGAVARNRNIPTKVGAYLDTIFDRYVEGMIFFGMLFLPLPKIWLPAYAWIFLAMFGSIVTTYAKAAVKEKDLVNQELKGGILSRGERMVLIFFALILGLIYPDFLYTTYILILIVILTNFTAIQRVWSGVRAIYSHE
ncbi:MAG: CDP-alcohol phosphatidyltransferase family protein [Candidatus Pacebacteria bacterium]|nr:CDP-alcohol phosphatidyltransferase family protein [Candidatus Paceibacterota bacterium]MDD5555206.1 CDP-alcohol phosphatidyltransferase family protein [Candidatus Paceibacterota bacterium]